MSWQLEKFWSTTHNVLLQNKIDIDHIYLPNPKKEKGHPKPMATAVYQKNIKGNEGEQQIQNKSR